MHYETKQTFISLFTFYTRIKYIAHIYNSAGMVLLDIIEVKHNC